MKRKAEADSDNQATPQGTKRTYKSTTEIFDEVHQISARRESTAKCNANLKNIAAETLSMVSPASSAEKRFPSAEHGPGVKVALKAYKKEKESLGKATLESVNKLASNDIPTKQDALLGSPETMLAQANALNITFHRLVRENGELKQKNDELKQKNVELREKNGELKEKNSELKQSTAELEDRVKAEQKSIQNLHIETSALEECIANLENENGKLKEEVAVAKKEASTNKGVANNLSHKMKTIQGLVKDV